MLHPGLPYADLITTAFEALFIQLPFSMFLTMLPTSYSDDVIAR